MSAAVEGSVCPPRRVLPDLDTSEDVHSFRMQVRFWLDKHWWGGLRQAFALLREQIDRGALPSAAWWLTKAG